MIYYVVKDAQHSQNKRDGGNTEDFNADQFVTDEAIARVMALGFDHQEALEAIIKAKGDVGEASMMLSCDQVIGYYDATVINNFIYS